MFTEQEYKRMDRALGKIETLTIKMKYIFKLELQRLMTENKALKAEIKRLKGSKR